MRRLVFDTNVVVSALLFRSGHLAWLRKAWSTGELVPVVSRETVAELIRVLAYPKFGLTDADVKELLAEYLPFAEQVNVSEEEPGPTSADPKDPVFVRLALASAVDAIVSGDRHLLQLDGAEGLRVIRPGSLAPDR